MPWTNKTYSIQLQCKMQIPFIFSKKTKFRNPMSNEIKTKNADEKWQWWWYDDDADDNDDDMTMTPMTMMMMIIMMMMYDNDDDDDVRWWWWCTMLIVVMLMRQRRRRRRQRGRRGWRQRRWWYDYDDDGDDEDHEDYDEEHDEDDDDARMMPTSYPLWCPHHTPMMPPSYFYEAPSYTYEYDDEDADSNAMVLKYECTEPLWRPLLLSFNRWSRIGPKGHRSKHGRFIFTFTWFAILAWSWVATVVVVIQSLVTDWTQRAPL